MTGPAPPSGAGATEISQALKSLGSELLAQRHLRLLRRIAARSFKQRTVLFFGRPTFADNSKYLFLHAAARPQNEVGFTPVWCTANAGLAAELKSHGLQTFHLGADANRTIQFLLTASAAVFCTNPREALLQPMFAAALDGAFKLQLWHGVGAKKIDLMLIDQMNLLNLDLLESLDAVSQVDSVLSPSGPYDRVWREAFGVERVLRAGLPRNEVLLRPATDLERMGAFDLPAADGQLRVLFAPTFTLASQTPVWQSPELLNAIRAGLPENKGHIFVKPHPFDAVRTAACRGIEGTHLIPADADIYPALREFDLLITDKSSLLTDFLLADKPVVILDLGYPAGQKDECAENPFSQAHPGISATPATLSPAVCQALTSDTMQRNRAQLRNRIFSTDPLDSCATLTRILATIVAERMESQRGSCECLPALFAGSSLECSIREVEVAR